MDRITLPLQYRKPVKTNATERGELLQYFLEAVNSGRDGHKYRKLRIPYIAMRLQGVPTKDLYALRSMMEDAARRGQSRSKVFFYQVKVQPTL